MAEAIKYIEKEKSGTLINIPLFFSSFFSVLT